jgi:hypothetical protein
MDLKMKLHSLNFLKSFFSKISIDVTDDIIVIAAPTETDNNNNNVAVEETGTQSTTAQPEQKPGIGRAGKRLWAGNTKGGSITVLLTSCLTSLESAVL